MFFGNCPLVVTLSLITVSAAMCHKIALEKLNVPPHQSSTFTVPSRSMV